MVMFENIRHCHRFYTSDLHKSFAHRVYYNKNHVNRSEHIILHICSDVCGDLSVQSFDVVTYFSKNKVTAKIISRTDFLSVVKVRTSCTVSEIGLTENIS